MAKANQGGDEGDYSQKYIKKNKNEKRKTSANQNNNNKRRDWTVICWVGFAAFFCKLGQQRSVSRQMEKHQMRRTDKKFNSMDRRLTEQGSLVVRL